ncbi:FliH/SctL family protein [Deltaproteobacteria bacterium TL4]
MYKKVDKSQIQEYVLPKFTERQEELGKEATDSQKRSNTPTKTPPKTVPSSGFKFEDFEDETKGRTVSLQVIALSDEDKVQKSAAFNSSKFVLENSLLSNAENYAQTIKEGAAIYAKQMREDADRKFAEAKAIHKEAEALRVSMRQERDQMIKEAERQVQTIKDNAFQDGFETGHAEGINRRYEEMGPLVAQIELVLEQLRNLRKVVRFQSEQELVQLAVIIAKKIVVKELTLNPDVQKNILISAMKELDIPGKIKIFLHPDDYDFLKPTHLDLDQYLNDEQSLVIKPSLEVVPGAILIETNESVINQSFEHQFEVMEEVLSQKLSERNARLHKVDMDEFDYSLPIEENDDGNEFA